jgi:hypothetical protein
VESTNSQAVKLVDGFNFKHLLNSDFEVVTHARISIELTDPTSNYRAGSQISGVVRIVVEGYFDAHSVSLGLIGFAWTTQTSRQTVVDINFKLHHFDTSLLKGHHAFPFNLTLPEWLPSSVTHKTDSSCLCVSYFLTAQLDPRAVDMFASRRTGLSLSRDERIIFIYQEITPEYPLDLRLVLRANIGGLLGFGSNSMEATVCLT